MPPNSFLQRGNSGSSGSCKQQRYGYFSTSKATLWSIFVFCTLLPLPLVGMQLLAFLSIKNESSMKEALIQQQWRSRKSQVTRPRRGKKAAISTKFNMRPNNTVVAEENFVLNDPPDPQVVYLMSYPNSGTSYTIANVEAMTNRTVASDYGDKEWPLATQRYRGGPFLKPDKLLPENSLLTKTHCGGYKKYKNPMIPEHDFSVSCGKGYITKPRVQKVIHLFRNPLDNLVSRMHNDIALKKRDRNEFPTSRDGLLKWCAEIVDDREEPGHYSKKVIKTLYEGLPCAMEWYRYALWHNRALAFEKEEKMNVHIVYYESYTQRWARTVNGILRFLEQPARGEPAPFLSNKSYLHFFSLSEFRRVKLFLKETATPKTWNHIKHYFEHDNYPQISFIGERHSGTNWMTKHLQDCFNHTITVKPSFAAWKHWFQQDVLSEASLPNVVVAQFRNPFEWTEAMRAKPYHAPAHTKMGWKKFVTTPWTMARLGEDVAFENVTRETSPDVECRCQKRVCFPWQPYEIIPCLANSTFAGPRNRTMRAFYELRNDGSGLPYSNILELRSAKIQNFLSVQNFSTVESFHLVRYEDLKMFGTQELLHQLELELGVKAECQPIQGSPEIKPRELKIGFPEYLREHIDWETEALLGYRPDTFSYS